MTLAVNVRYALPHFPINVAFTCERGLTALYGPSGCGKTTLINLIAGLATPNHGLIRINDDVLFDSERRINLPPQQRRVGYVFQDARLFPHLTVEQNLNYGRWFNRRREGATADREAIITMLGLAQLLQSRPATLSGGEKQRVAIGRALLASPRLLLMDEPLASLDEARKQEIMPYIERLRDEWRIPIIYVSHSVAEVARLANDVVIMDKGRAVAFGPANDMLRELDVLTSDEGHDAGSVVAMTVADYDPGFDMTHLVSAGGSAYIQGQHGEAGATVRLRIKSRDVMLALEKPSGISALTQFSGTVAELTPIGASVRVTVKSGDAMIAARITRKSQAAMNLKVGTPVHAIAKSVSLDQPGHALALQSNFRSSASAVK